MGKSLPPKYGLLQMVLEPYLRGKVYDIVSMPHSRVLKNVIEELFCSSGCCTGDNKL